MFTVGPVHTRDHGPVLFRCLKTEPAARLNRKVMTVNRKGRKHSPRSPGVPQVRPEI